MQILLRILFVASFCVATVGAAGFATPMEPLAWPLFGSGLGLTLASGWALRRAARAAAATAASGEASLTALGSEVARIRDAVRALAGEAHLLDGPALAARLDAVILSCRMLGNRNEEFLRALGTQAYVRVWDGFATAERLLARAWSMAADGFPHEARLELPKARAHLERAVAAAHV
jgi:hypothetical protein